MPKKAKKKPAAKKAQKAPSVKETLADLSEMANKLSDALAELAVRYALHDPPTAEDPEQITAALKPIRAPGKTKVWIRKPIIW